MRVVCQEDLGIHQLSHMLNCEARKMKIHITEKGKFELKRLGFDISNSIQKILKYIPNRDISSVGKILITDISNTTKAAALYVPKYKENPARIELYLKRLFSHIKHDKNFGLMLAIQEIGLAHAIFHETGHHVRIIRSHGIKKKRSEKHASLYANNALDRYVLDNAQSINTCYDNLERVAKKQDLDIDIINDMRIRWMRHYEKAVKKNTHWP